MSFEFSNSGVELAPTKVYHGSHQSDDLLLRIGNGGAGQSGLIGALADAFIDYLVAKGNKPFAVGWFLGDTTATIGFIANKEIDIGVTYNAAAEQQSLDSGHSVRRIAAFRDHFLLVGPKPDKSGKNPAGLSPNDSVETMFSKIVSTGNDTTAAIPTRFLSRFDKSATNIKESEIFVKIGQTPWSFPYSTWYHQYPRFPFQALAAAGVLGEYTLTDRGTLLSVDPSVRDSVHVYLAGTDDPKDILLNPASALLAAEPSHPDIAKAFIDWLKSDSGGQAVVKGFKVGGEQLYSPAPDS